MSELDESGTDAHPENAGRHGALLPRSRSVRRPAAHHVIESTEAGQAEPPADSGTARLFGWRRRAPEAEPTSGSPGTAAPPITAGAPASALAGEAPSTTTEDLVPTLERPSTGGVEAERTARLDEALATVARDEPRAVAAATPAPLLDDDQLCQLDDPNLLDSIYSDPRTARHAPFGVPDGAPHPAPSYAPPPLSGVPYEEEPGLEPPAATAATPPDAKPLLKQVLRVREIAPIKSLPRPAPKPVVPPAAVRAPDPATARPAADAGPGRPVPPDVPPHQVAVPPAPVAPVVIPVLRTPPVRLKATPLVAPVSVGAQPGARPDEVVVKPPQPPSRLASRRGKRSGRVLSLLLLGMLLAGGAAGAAIASSGHHSPAALVTTTAKPKAPVTTLPAAVHGPRGGAHSRSCTSTPSHGRTSTTKSTHTSSPPTTLAGGCTAHGGT